MEDRAKIIGKLNALRAKANNAGSPEEALTFMEGFNRLMAKYKLTETDLEIRESTVSGFAKAATKSISEIELIVLKIAELTETRVISPERNKFVFLGLMADLQYANWLYELIATTMERSVQAYKASLDYHNRINSGSKSVAIMSHYKAGFTTAINTKLQAMIDEAKKPGQSLVVLKNAIIQAFIDENDLNQGTEKGGITIYEGLHEVAEMGHTEGDRVRLRKEAESVVKGYLN